MQINGSFLKKLFSQEEVIAVRLDASAPYRAVRLLADAIPSPGQESVYVGDASDVPDPLAIPPDCCLVLSGAGAYAAAALPCGYILLSDRCTLQAAYDRIRSAWESYEYKLSLDFYTALQACSTIDEILTAAADMMRCPILLAGNEGRLIAHRRSDEIEDPSYTAIIKTGHTPDIYMQAAQADGVADRVKDTYLPISIGAGQYRRRNRLLSNIRIDGRAAGFVIVLEGDHPLTPQDSKCVTSLCNAITDNIKKAAPDAAHPDIESVYYSQAFRRLLYNTAPVTPEDTKWLRLWKVHHAWEDRCCFRACFIRERSAKARADLEALIRRCCPYSMVFLLHVDEGLFLLDGACSYEDESRIFNILTASLADTDFRLYHSEPFGDIEELPAQEQLLIKTIRTSIAIDYQGKTCCWRDVKIFGLLLEIPKDRRDTYRERSLDNLKEYDRRHGTNYCLTLYTYLRCACSKSRMAGGLFMHRNTASYQINKIEEILGADLSDGETCLRYYLSFKIDELRGH